MHRNKKYMALLLPLFTQYPSFVVKKNRILAISNSYLSVDYLHSKRSVYFLVF